MRIFILLCWHFFRKNPELVVAKAFESRDCLLSRFQIILNSILVFLEWVKLFSQSFLGGTKAKPKTSTASTREPGRTRCRASEKHEKTLAEGKCGWWREAVVARMLP